MVRLFKMESKFVIYFLYVFVIKVQLTPYMIFCM